MILSNILLKEFQMIDQSMQIQFSNFDPKQIIQPEIFYHALMIFNLKTTNNRQISNLQYISIHRQIKCSSATHVPDINNFKIAKFYQQIQFHQQQLQMPMPDIKQIHQQQLQIAGHQTNSSATITNAGH